MNKEPGDVIFGQETVSDQELEKLTTELTILLKNDDRHLECQILSADHSQTGIVMLHIQINYSRAQNGGELCRVFYSISEVRTMIENGRVDRSLLSVIKTEKQRLVRQNQVTIATSPSRSYSR